jgi:predicted ATPase
MIIKISNFGPIKEFEFDLDKDLTVTYGSNNIGKSYAMQIVYLLLKNISDLRPRNNFLFHHFERGLSNENDIFQSIVSMVENSTKQIDITDKINMNISNKLEFMIGSRLYNSFKNTFGDLTYLGGSEKKNKPTVRIVFDKYDVNLIIGDGIKFENFDMKYKIYGKKNDSKRLKTNRENNTFIYFNDNAVEFILAIKEIIEKETNRFIQTVCENVSDVYFLPASRSGIYSGMSAFGQIIAELSRNRSLLTKKIELPGISEPISDYFISLTEINNVNKMQHNAFVTIAKEIEKEIIKGEVRFDNKKKALLYKPANVDIDLEMTSVSSMVSEMSPIVAFLKYIIARNNSMNQRPINRKSKPIIFIEEPEAHLHPENQVKLIQIFAKLIDYNVKLIVTSHSNYIFNKLNNLVLAKKLEVKRYCPIILKQESAGSVSKQMDIDELGVSDENFIDISETLYVERENIIEELNAGVDEDDYTDKE